MEHNTNWHKLGHLAKRIIASQHAFNHIDVGMGLRGLRRIHSTATLCKVKGCNKCLVVIDNLELVLAALVPKIAGCPQQLNAQALGSSLYGMQNMRCDVLEVQQVLAAWYQRLQAAHGSSTHRQWATHFMECRI